MFWESVLKVEYTVSLKIIGLHSLMPDPESGKCYIEGCGQFVQHKICSNVSGRQIILS